MVKLGVVEGHIKGIKLPLEDRQQVLAQFADDTSFTLLGEERPVKYLINTLDTFCEGSGLVLNWDKSCGYWWTRGGGGRPNWTNELHISWANEGDISKLLGSIFGLSLST